MKILMMTPWNAPCGVSIHAELVGREWVRMGHELKVLAPFEEARIVPTAPDEPYVTRCYTVDRSLAKGEKILKLDPGPFLTAEYEIFVLQGLEIMPFQELAKIWPQIKRKSKTILVIHEGYILPPEYYVFDWDAVVCFDERYKKEFSKVFPPEKIHIIPYPCHPPTPGSKVEARKKLGLPQRKKIILSYGIVIQQHFPVLSSLKELKANWDFTYLLLPAERTAAELVNKVKAEYNFIEVREGARSLEELYTYLHASDALLLHKHSPNLVVSSSVYLCLGSGCPIIISEGRYTEDLGEEVLKFKDFAELKELLAQVFMGRRPEQKAVEKFLREKSVSRVASLFLELFSILYPPRFIGQKVEVVG